MIRTVLVFLLLYFVLCFHFIITCKNNSQKPVDLPAFNTPPVPEYSASSSAKNAPIAPPTPALNDSFENHWKSFSPFDHAYTPQPPNGKKEADWSKAFGISSWAQEHHANGGFKYENVIPQNDGSCILRVDKEGSAEIQQVGAKMRKGRIGVVANLGQLRKGVISAPVWMYSGYIPRGTKFEVDVEFTGNTGIEINYHDGLRAGKNYYRLDRDFSGEDIKIEYDFDIDAGYFNVIINEELIYTITKEEVEADGYQWINKAVFPIYMAWAFDHSWAGGNFDQSAPAYELTLKKRLTIAE